MLIEHTSRSTKDKPEIYNCVGALRRSTGCFNQQSLNMVSQPAMSHNPLGQRNGQLKSQCCQSTQIATAARSTLKSQSQHFALKIVPKNAYKENQDFGKVLGPFDLAMTKVNTGQSCCKNPSQKQKSENSFLPCYTFPRVKRRDSK